MKNKKLVKLLSVGLIAVTMLAPIQASAATFNGAPTYEQNASYYNQTIKVQDITVGSAIAYGHNSNNIWNKSATQYKVTVNLVVSNLTYNKTIVMHNQLCDGTWCDSQKAIYVKSLGNGKELWKIETSVADPAQFVFNYKEVNAWDNNNYQNYTLDDFR